MPIAEDDKIKSSYMSHLNITFSPIALPEELAAEYLEIFSKILNNPLLVNI